VAVSCSGFHVRLIGKELSIFTGCMPVKLSNMQRRKFNLPCVGTTKQSASSPVRLLASTVWYVDVLIPLPSLGKGSHADGGVSKLRPALEELCDEYVLYLTSHHFVSSFLST